MTEPTHYSTEGHRLLCESDHSPAEIARLAGLDRRRVSEWRKGDKRPDPEARAALERAGVPSAAWDRPPTGRPSPEATPTTAPAMAPAAPASLDLSDDAIEALGVAGIRQVIARLRAMSADLPPRERVSAAVAEGRLHDRLEAIRQKDADARADYFDSADFREDVKTLAAALPGDAAELRGRLARLGIDLPAPPNAATPPTDAPTTVADVVDLCRELEVARDFRAAGEPLLAMAHTAGLALDVHADAIAEVLAADGALAARFLGLLDAADERIIRAALERRMAIRVVAALDPKARRAVADLLGALGHTDVAKELASC